MLQGTSISSLSCDAPRSCRYQTLMDLARNANCHPLTVLHTHTRPANGASRNFFFCPRGNRADFAPHCKRRMIYRLPLRRKSPNVRIQQSHRRMASKNDVPTARVLMDEFLADTGLAPQSAQRRTLAFCRELVEVAMACLIADSLSRLFFLLFSSLLSALSSPHSQATSGRTRSPSPTSWSSRALWSQPPTARTTSAWRLCSSTPCTTRWDDIATTTRCRAAASG